MIPKNIAIIGYGYWGKKLYNAFASDNRFKVLKILARDPMKIGTEIDSVLLESNIESILSDNRIQAIVVATPKETHSELAQLIISAGKHLFIEKPLSIEKHSERKFQSLLQNSDCKILVDYTFSFHPALKEIKEIIRRGELGPIHGIRLVMTQLGRFRSTDVYSLLGSHMLAVLNEFIPLENMQFKSHNIFTRGQITETGMIYCHTNHGDFGNIANSFRGLIWISLNELDKQRQITIYGDKGTILYDLDSEAPIKAAKYQVDRRISDLPLSASISDYTAFTSKSGLRYAISEFHDLLLNKRISNLGTAILIDNILRSI